MWLVPGMKRRRGGRIVNISSIYAMGGSALASHYAVALRSRRVSSRPT
jgi:NAD(P)-dependent dehydrogenase (short-subunit alcohol dehydrogenase family)